MDSQMTKRAEEILSENYHYRHARNLSQLNPVRIFSITGNAVEIYRKRCLELGQKAGDIKFLALRKETDWHTFFSG